ncbi:hypothetical protein MCOR25_010511 [Pyricularia grisea]|nr:hypothetical protein MCOR25_010511 [Pyricularia grisea]
MVLDAKPSGLLTPIMIPVNEYQNGERVFSPTETASYAWDREVARTSGLTFAGRGVLLTGAGEGSIGSYILRALLSGSARVTVTTGSYCPETRRSLQALYARHGSRSSVLRVLPFNQGS